MATSPKHERQASFLSSRPSTPLRPGAVKRARMGSATSSQLLEKEPLVETIGDHDDRINCMVLSDDQSLLVTASDDNTARMWSTYGNDTDCLGIFRGHSSYINAMALVDMTLLTGSADCTIRKWDMASCECLFVYEGHTARIQKVMIAASMVISSSYDSTARMWLLDTTDLERGEEQLACRRVFEGHNRAVYSLIFVPRDLLVIAENEKENNSNNYEQNEDSGKNKRRRLKTITPRDLLITGSADGTARAFDFRTAKCLKIYKGHRNAITTMSTDTRGTTLFTAGADGTINSWDVLSGQQLRIMQGHKGSVLSMIVSNRLMYTASADGTAKAWVAEFGDNTRTYRGHKHSVQCLNLHHGILFTGCGDGVIRAFDARSGTLKAQLRRHEASVTCLAVVGDKLFSGSSDMTLRVWDIREIKEDALLWADEDGLPDDEEMIDDSDGWRREAPFYNHKASVLKHLFVLDEASDMATLHNLAEQNEVEEESELLVANDDPRTRSSVLSDVDVVLAKIHDVLNARRRDRLRNKSVGDALQELLEIIYDLLLIDRRMQTLIFKVAQVLVNVLCHFFPEPKLQQQTLMNKCKVASLESYPFINRGGKVKSSPVLTLFPKSIDEIVAIVQYAKQASKRVRVVGFRNAFAAVYADTDELLISLLPPEATDPLAKVRDKEHYYETKMFFELERIQAWKSELRQINIVAIDNNNENNLENNSDVVVVKLGGAVTRLEFIRWLAENDLDLELDLSNPLATVVGSMMRESSTLRRQVVSLDLVDPKGEVLHLDQPEVIEAVFSSFGVAGVVVGVEVKVDRRKIGWHIDIGGNHNMEESLKSDTIGGLCDNNNYLLTLGLFCNQIQNDGFWRTVVTKSDKRNNTEDINKDPTEDTINKYDVNENQEENNKNNAELVSNDHGEEALRRFAVLATEILAPVVKLKLYAREKRIPSELMAKIGRNMVKRFTQQQLRVRSFDFDDWLEASVTMAPLHLLKHREIEMAMAVERSESRLIRDTWYVGVGLTRAKEYVDAVGLIQTMELDHKQRLVFRLSSTIFTAEHKWEDLKNQLVKKMVALYDERRIEFNLSKELPSKVPHQGSFLSGDEYVHMNNHLDALKIGLAKVGCVEDMKNVFGNNRLNKLLAPIFEE